MKAAVVGSGAWGTALALCLHRNGHDVALWFHNPEKAAQAAQTRRNPRLPGILLPAGITVTADPACVAGCPNRAIVYEER